MIVLGVSGVFGHDPAACLLMDGRLMGFAEEERFTRRKRSPGDYPVAATAYCLHEAGIEPEDIDVVAASWDPDLDPTSRVLKAWIPRFMCHPSWRHARPQVRYVPHHLAHAAAAAYFAGPTSNTAVLVIDGNGENAATTIARLGEHGYEVLEQYPISQSLGHFYQRGAQYLGLGSEGEGKLMALAGFGRPDQQIDIVKVGDAGYSIGLEGIDEIPGAERFRQLGLRWDGWYRSRFGEPRTIDWAITQGTTDKFAANARIAASLQLKLVQSVQVLARRATELAGSRSLILAGGVALNCGANGAVLDTGAADELILFPACHDAGGALGAAAWAARESGDRWQPNQAGPYLGPSWQADAVADCLSEHEIQFETLDDPAATAADLLAQELVIGWHQGRMEAGPRALGNRSILARADQPEVAARVNRIKCRETWRPFGPAVSWDIAPAIFERPLWSPLMLIFRETVAGAAACIEGACHADGTSRPQTVTPRSNLRLSALLREFEAIGGAPAVLNTSFNLKGEPLVCSPADAIRCFRNSGLDALVIENFLVRR